MNFLTKLAFCASLLPPCLASVTARAQDTDIGELRNEALSILIDLHEDGSYDEIIDRSAIVETPAALQRWKALKLRFQPAVIALGIDRLSIRTQSGKTYAVAAREMHAGEAGVPGNESVLELIMPELKIGDTISYRLRIAHKPLLTARDFSIAYQLNPYVVSGNNHLKIVYPASQTLDVDVGGFTSRSDRVEDKRKIIELAYDGSHPLQRTRDRIDERLAAPHVNVSSFRSYETLGTALAPAFEHADGGKQVEALAHSLAQGKQNDTAIVRALHAWVVDNIAYDDRDIHADGLRARDLSAVLANRRGDCKDHAALMAALLDAVGIKSIPVLIGLDNNYTLPRVPVVQAFNHVINYVPAFGGYVDSTAKYASLGVLPLNELGKPVLFLGSAPHLAVSPARSSNDSSVTHTALTFTRDGRVRGGVDAEYGGAFAPEMRRIAVALQAIDTNDAVKSALLASGLRMPEGSVRFAADDARAVATSHMTYTGLGALQPAGGALVVDSQFKGPFAISTFMRGVLTQPESQAFLCGAKTIEEHYALTFPGSVILVSLPAPVSYRGAHVAYQATYTRKMNTVLISRRLTDDTPRPVCTAQDLPALKKVGELIYRDVTTPIRYQFN